MILVAISPRSSPLPIRIRTSSGSPERNGGCLLHQRASGARDTAHLRAGRNVRDFFSRVIYAARVSLPLGFTTVLITIVIGTVIGAIAGYEGGATT